MAGVDPDSPPGVNGAAGLKVAITIESIFIDALIGAKYCFFILSNFFVNLLVSEQCPKPTM